MPVIGRPLPFDCVPNLECNGHSGAVPMPDVALAENVAIVPALLDDAHAAGIVVSCRP